MLRLVCPKCRKDSYRANVESFDPCPYCGFIYSGTYGSVRRCEERIKQEIPFVFSYQEQHFEASTVDFSERGLGIEIFGKPPIAAGNTIDLAIGDLRIGGKVIWVRKLPDKSLAGLRRLN